MNGADFGAFAGGLTGGIGAVSALKKASGDKKDDKGGSAWGFLGSLMGGDPVGQAEGASEQLGTVADKAKDILPLGGAALGIGLGGVDSTGLAGKVLDHAGDSLAGKVLKMKPLGLSLFGG